MKSELLQVTLFAGIIVLIAACAHGYQTYWVTIQESHYHAETELRIKFELQLQEAIDRHHAARARLIAREWFDHQNDVASSYLQSAKDAATTSYLAYWGLASLGVLILREYYPLRRHPTGGTNK